MSPRRNHRQGFTLLEVLISVTILAFIAIFTTNMISQGVKAKKKVQVLVERATTLRDALNVMRSDVELAFNYRDINIDLYNAAQEERKKRKAKPGGNNTNTGGGNTNDSGNNGGNQTGEGSGQNTAGVDPNADYALKEKVIYSRFFGESDKINFTSLNFFRNRKNMPLSDQSEIGYYLENCRSKLDTKKSSLCLWRRTSPYIDEDVKDGGKSNVLLDNVKSLKFRYLGPGHEEEWLENWATEGGEEVMKGKFPYAVEITLTVMDQNFDPPKEVGMTVVAALKFPNNVNNKPEGADDAAPTD